MEVRTHRTADAMKSFNEVLRLNPRAYAAQVQLSNLHLLRSNVDSAVLLADEAIRNAPASLDGYLARVRAWMARGDTRRAKLELAAIRKQRPDLAAVAALEGTINLRTGALAAARAAFERTARLDPQSVEAFQSLTELDLREGRIADARARVEARLSAGEETPVVLLLGSRMLLAAGDRQRAEALLRSSIVKDPLEIANYALLGRILFEDGRLASAKTEFEQAAAADSSNMSARLMLGMIAHAQNDTEQAKRWYGEVLKLEPRAALAANNMAAIYADSGVNLDIAQQLAETAVEQWPAAAEFQDTLGWVLYQRQLSGQAIPRFQQSLAADPANPVYHYHLGLMYAKNGDRDRARTSLRRALELHPEFSDARRVLATIEH
jgi:Tfp pilus assembly protein PilF